MLLLSVKTVKIHCRTGTVNQHELFCNDAVVATATTHIVIDQYQTFYIGTTSRQWIHNLLCQKLCIIGVFWHKLMPKILVVRFFETRFI